MAFLNPKALTRQISLEVRLPLLQLPSCECADDNLLFPEDGHHAHINSRVERVGLEDHELTRRIRNIRARVTKIDEHMGLLASYLSDFEDALADLTAETL